MIGTADAAHGVKDWPYRLIERDFKPSKICTGLYSQQLYYHYGPHHLQGLYRYAQLCGNQPGQQS